jgi:proteasome lid subunit RPN8/RPN11
MIRIAPEPWAAMLKHACEAYPNECCGAMLGTVERDGKLVRAAMPLGNDFEGARAARYELRPEDLLAADRAAREREMRLIGVYHSHPDCDAAFSRTDLENSCPWYSFVVLSIRNGEFHHANSWLADFDRTGAAKEELTY